PRPRALSVTDNCDHHHQSLHSFPTRRSSDLTRLINQIMIDGKRGKAQKILYKAFELVGERSGQNPMDVFDEAMKNVMPVLEDIQDRKSTRLNSSHVSISYAVFCSKKKMR